MTLQLTQVRDQLEQFELSFLMRLLERVQYKRNYEKSRDGGLVLNKMLGGFERTTAPLGKFTDPTEKQFFSKLPEPLEKSKVCYPINLDAAKPINYTNNIMDAYYPLLDNICDRGDDGHYGSTVERDISVLKLLAKRIHYASFHVAQAKYVQDPKTFNKLLKEKDYTGLIKLLVKPEQEERIFQRVENNILVLNNLYPSTYELPTIPVIDFFKETIIPLTLKGELAYLVNLK